MAVRGCLGPVPGSLHILVRRRLLQCNASAQLLGCMRRREDDNSLIEHGIISLVVSYSEDGDGAASPMSVWLMGGGVMCW